MTANGSTVSLEDQIEQWRSFLRRRQAIHSVDIAELEDHLREQVAGLTAAGLAPDEAFLVAVKRMGNLDAVSREFAREHSDRLWKQMVASPAAPDDDDRARTETMIAFGLATLAAVLIKAPELFGKPMSVFVNSCFYALNMSFFVLPLVTAYFVWKRKIGIRTTRWLAAAFVLAAVVVNVYPFEYLGYSHGLTALHLPMALWFVVGVAYAGSRWNEVSGRMDFIRFTGELLIYFVLIALGGGVLSAFMLMMFQYAGINAAPFFQYWLLPCGAVGAVVIASWLVEAKQSVIENMAPVLARLFTPLFAAVLVAFLGALLWNGRGVGIDRDLLIAFDLLLVVVLGLVLYSASARDPGAPPGIFDVMQVVLIVSMLLADAVALWAISARISEFGFTPNRVAALGENVILLVNLGWSAWLYIRFLMGKGTFMDLVTWQTNFLPVYPLWAAIVVVAFPPAFGFI